MLRAASRGVRRQIGWQNTRTQLTFERPSLSWLFPSHQCCAEQTRQPSTLAGNNPAPSETSLKPSDRSYSTAAAAMEIPDIDPPGISPPIGDNGLPFVRRIEPLDILDPSQVIAFENPVPEKEGKRVRVSKFATGISSEKNEVLATFNACINVGMVVRAQAMLEQITHQLERESPVLINAHNSFLKALLDRSKQAHDLDSLKGAQDLKVFFMWYENRMQQCELFGDSTTFALLLKASLMIESETGRKMYVKEYVRRWKERSDIGEVLGSTLLTDDDVMQIAKTCRLKINELHEKHKVIIAEKKRNLPPPDILSVPEAKATKVKGAGLAAVKSSLRSLIDVDHMPLREYEMSAEDLEFQIERQRILEEDAFDSAQERWKRDSEAMSEKGVLSINKSVNALLWEWHQGFVPLIKEELIRVKHAESKAVRSAGSADRCLYGPFLRLVEPEKTAAIVMVELLKTHATVGASDGLKTSRAVLHVSRQLEMEYMAQEIRKKENAGVFGHLKKHEMAELFRHSAASAAVIAKARRNLEKAPEPTLGMLPDWPTAIKAKLGAVLISMLIHCAKVPVTATRTDTGEPVTQNFSAFHHTYEYLKGRKLGVIKLHEDLVKRLGTGGLNNGILGKNLPMVVRPRPWTDWDEGGYYYTRSRVIRIKDSEEQKQYVTAAASKGHLDRLFAGLDVLGQTAWRINRKVFDVVLEVWNSEQKFAEIPAADKEIDYPPEPAPGADPKARHEWMTEMKRLNTERRNDHSTRCSVNFKVEIARAFLFERFYFPHSVDFRGRAYPISPHLNHIGNDLSRGLLMFHEGKELGQSGLRWIKIHLANLAGFDKASFEDRVGFVDGHVGEIRDSAKNPLSGKKWWLEAEDPWQCLATCFALSEALEMDDPSKYECHIPVAQDGTCNGLQHYAALGGDLAGAKQVNLEPSDKPQDVYTGVAELVKEQVEKGLNSGDPRAQALHGLITRKVVKQTVMTSVYGVTFIGAKSQIESQLNETGKFGRKEIPALALYLTRMVFSSIRSMFSGANMIQRWLVMCAKRISRSVGPCQLEHLKDPDTGLNRKSVHFMTSVIWTTPLGLPVVQPYRQCSSQPISTNLQNVYISDPTVIDQVDSRKQMTAFPPNFIHSLDATHMLLSALACAEEKLTFASVHDSFWTHPSDVDKMNRILRDAFVQLHSRDIMDSLRAEFEERYRGFRSLTTIHGNTECAKEIKRIRKLRAIELHGKPGLTVVEDLQWELERWNLIHSEVPEEQRRGEGMVTPSVILDKHGGLEQNEVEDGNARLLFDYKLGSNAKTGGGITDAPGNGSERDNVDALEDLSDVDTSLQRESESLGGLGEGVLDESQALDESMLGESALDESQALDESVLDESQALGEGAVDESQTLGEGVLDESQALGEAKVVGGKGKKKPTAQGAATGNKGPRGMKKQQYVPVLNVWVQLRFPPLPPKGDFDVTKLMESEYFFS